MTVAASGRLLRIKLDDHLFIRGNPDFVTLRQATERYGQPLLVDSEPSGAIKARVFHQVARGQPSGGRTVADRDDVADPDPEGCDIHPAAIDLEMTVIDQLPGLHQGTTEPGTESDAVETGLKETQQVFTGHATHLLGLAKGPAELFLQQAVGVTQLLLFNQLLTVVGHLAPGLVRSMLAGAVAAALGIGDLVRFLGYVPEDELERVLAATDVAVCPFERMSASGALATWFSAGRPIVTSDLAPFRELKAMQPGALHIFRPYEAGALARCISATLDVATDEHDRDVEALARRLAAPRIVDRYVGLYRAAASH